MRRFAQISLFSVVLTALCVDGFANEYTDVIDAFDRDNKDPFDLNIKVGYETQRRSSVITREAFTNDPDHHPDRLDYYNYRKMHEYNQVVHLLNVELALGLYKDLALKVRAPLILSDSRLLTKHDDNSWHDVNGDGDADVLFGDRVQSPDRSGVDHVAVGLWWGILDQGRDDTKPNWTLFAEGRFGVGDPLKAACESCGDGINRDGGISRGLTELVAGTRLSRRYGYWDPFFGFEAIIGWPKKDSDNAYYQEDDRDLINHMPPIVGRMDFGLEIIPWERPAEGQRVVITIGGGGEYHSEGREYTPLFDALGTAPHFDPKKSEFVDFNGNGANDGGDEVKAKEVWTGLTDVENYALFYGKLSAMVQLAPFIQFRAGGGLALETDHFITKTDSCSLGAVGSNGSCEKPNLAHRPEIDRAGNRFRVEDSILWSFAVDLTAQF